MKLVAALSLLGAALLVRPVGPVTVVLGDHAPEIEGTWLHHPESSLAELRGRLLLLDFWRTWCQPCLKAVPHLNALQRRYGSRGLTVIGVTDESEDLVLATVGRVGMEFPIVYRAPSWIDAAYGIRGFPTSVLVGPDGTILWRGHPAAFERDIEPVLPRLLRRAEKDPAEGVRRLVQELRLPERAPQVAAAIASGAWGEAWALAEAARGEGGEDAGGLDSKAAGGEADVLETVRQRLHAFRAARLAEAEAARAETRFSDAHRVLQREAVRFAGAPGEDPLALALAALADEPAAAADLAAGEQHDAALSAWRAGRLSEALELLARLVKDHPDTATAAAARAWLARHGRA